MNRSSVYTRIPRLLFTLLGGVLAGLFFLVAVVSAILGGGAVAILNRARRQAGEPSAQVMPVQGSPARERPEAHGWTRTLKFRILMLLVTLSTAIGIVGAAVLIPPRAAVMTLIRGDEPVVTIAGGDVEAGKDALQAYGCIACHTVPGASGSYRANVGPPLTGWAGREYIAGALPNTPDNLILWIQDPHAVEPGTVMPDLGVSEQDARDIAAYLYTLGGTGIFQEGEGAETAGAGTPEATPAAGEADATPEPGSSPETGVEVTVESVDIDFNPNEFTIPANTDVTVHLPNNGAAPHTFTIDELGIDVELAPGEEQMITINAPAGTYEYYCAVPGHAEAGMVGTMTVE
ncbi:MAG TPA: cupredoxin domain-containing protein [Thermomicrobiales bacterium]|nr:cupredoxin domain-containing protein [Thermomicrobiales bacterium]